MAVPAFYAKPFQIYRGDTFIKILTIEKALTFDPTNAVLTSEPIDLTAYGNEWNAQIRASEDNPVDIPFELDLSQLSTGIITFRLESDATAEVASKGVWDLQVVDTAQTPNYVRTLLRGTFMRTKDVTRL